MGLHACLCLGIPESCQTHSLHVGIPQVRLNGEKDFVILKAAIVRDTDECDVTLKYELTISCEHQSRKDLALKIHAVHSLCFAASCN